MKRRRLLLIVLIATSVHGADWKIAEPGWRYQFPRDHHAHRDFKTEWWYFTGNLTDAEGHRFGYQLTFFRDGILPQTERGPNISRFVIDDLKFAHFALTDVSKARFIFEQKTSRGAFGEAGFDDSGRLAWIENWALGFNGEELFKLSATDPKGAIQLQLHATKQPVVHGEDGVSVKAKERGAASHYYSIPQLTTTGELIAGGKSYSVRGDSWFDHEWGTSRLGEGQAGWDWICLQWDNGNELMIYQMRLKNGEPDSTSSGTLIAADGTPAHLRNSDFQMKPIGFWKSNVTDTKYPVGWQVTLPGQRIEFVIRPVLEDQELALGPITYWEGAVDVRGTQSGRTIKGCGYLELTGYSGRLGEVLGR
jgi:predicted secreted hydrolase